MASNQQSDCIANYKVYKNIGSGGFASVYKAYSIERDRDVAIKFIDRKKMCTEQMLRRMESEVKIHIRLKHPHIVELFSFFYDELYIYLVLELCSNGDLSSYLKKLSKLPATEDEACRYLRPVIEAFLYLHKHCIMHRDLKLSNILLTQDMTVKVADFGVATRLSQPEEQHLTMCGTPNYISPEVATRKPHGLSVDVWSIGCMLYSLLVGEPPFNSPDVRNTIEKVISVDYHLPEQLSEDAKDLIRSLLRKEAKDRITLEQILQHPFFTKRDVSSSGFDDGNNETSTDSGRDTLATMSASLMTNAYHSLSSSDSNCPPRSSATPASSSPSCFVQNQTEQTRSKVSSLARIFSGVTDAAQPQFQPSLRSSLPPQLQTPVRQFIGSTRPIQQRQSSQKPKQQIQFNNGSYSNIQLAPATNTSVHAFCESCSANLSSIPAPTVPNPINNGPNPALSGQNSGTTSSNSGGSGQIPTKTSSNSAMASSKSARTGQKSTVYRQNSVPLQGQRISQHSTNPAVGHNPNPATLGSGVSQPGSSSTTPVPSEGKRGFRVEQLEQDCVLSNGKIQTNQRCYNPGLYQTGNGYVPSPQNGVSQTDQLSRRLEPDFDEMEMRQQMESPASNRGSDTQPSCSSSPRSGFADDNKLGLNLELNQQEIYADSDGYLSGNDGVCAGKYPLQHHHSDSNLFQVDGLQVYSRPRGDNGLGLHSPATVQKSLTLQRVHPTCQPSLSQLRSRSVENLSHVGGRRSQSRWAAVSIDVDGQQQQQWLVPPLCALRLSPTNQKTKCAVAHILESGDVCLEFFQLYNSRLRICQGLLISPDGLRIKVYKLDSPLDPSLKPVPQSLSLGPCKKFLYSKLPEKYWKQYEYASRFVNFLRSETTKVILYSDRGKAMLMENTPNPNFTVCFYNGAKFKVSSQETKIIQADGSSMTLQSTGSFAHLSPETQELWHHVQTLLTVCKELDEFFTERVSNEISCFPIVIRGTPSASAVMSKMIESKKHVDANDDQRSSIHQPMPTGFPASDKMSRDARGSTATQSRQLRSASSATIGSHAPVKMTERQQEAFVRNQPVQLRPMNVHACPEQKSVGQPLVRSQMNSSDVQIVKEIYEPKIGKAMEFSNGLIVIQHNDGSEIQLDNLSFSIMFKDCQGRSRTFMAEDKLPMDIALLLSFMKEKLSSS